MLSSKIQQDIAQVLQSEIPDVHSKPIIYKPYDLGLSYTTLLNFTFLICKMKLIYLIGC